MNSPADPRAIATLTDRAWVADCQRMYGVARENYEALLSAVPGHIFALSRLLTIAGYEGRLGDADVLHKMLVEAVAKADLAAVRWPHLALVAFQNVIRPLPQPLYAAVTRALDVHMAALATPKLATPKPARPAGQRLKLGYLSGLLRNHPVGHVTAALFAAHDRARFDVHVFTRPAPGAPDTYAETIRKGAEHFVPLSGTPRQMADTIAAHDLDMLIYIDGYTEVDLLQAVAARPAPIQVFWLGHPGNCDISAIDYVLADATVIPPGEEMLYAAKVIRLPGAYHCATPQRIGDAVTRAWAGLPGHGFIFCAFNNPEKIDHGVFTVWMNILKGVEGSVLWLSQGSSPSVADNLRRFAAAQGVDGARLIFAARVPEKTQL